MKQNLEAKGINQSYLSNFDMNFEDVETKHFWYIVRKKVIKYLLDTHIPKDKKDKSCVEIGCGSGSTLTLLNNYFEKVSGVEPYQSTFIKNQVNQFPISKQNAEDFFRFKSAEYDLVAAFDVLEHIEFDENILKIINNSLKPGGKLIITVPAMKILWSSFDIFDLHYRRYNRKELILKLESSGFKVERVSYFFLFLVPVVFAVRKMRDLLKKEPSSQNNEIIKPLNCYLNMLLIYLHEIELFILKVTDLPFGSSLVCVAKKQIIKL